MARASESGIWSASVWPAIASRVLVRVQHSDARVGNNSGQVHHPRPHYRQTKFNPSRVPLRDAPGQPEAINTRLNHLRIVPVFATCHPSTKLSPLAFRWTRASTLFSRAPTPRVCDEPNSSPPTIKTILIFRRVTRDHFQARWESLYV